MKYQSKSLPGNYQPKYFILDTSSFMLNPAKALFVLSQSSIPPEMIESSPDLILARNLKSLSDEIKGGAPNNIIIPQLMMWELNNIKDNEKAEYLSKIRAINALGTLSSLINYGHSKSKSEFLNREGIVLPNNAIVRMIRNDERTFSDQASHYKPTRDDMIIYDGMQFIKKCVYDTICADKKINKEEMLTNLNNPDINLVDLYGHDIMASLIFQFVSEDEGFLSSVILEKGKLADGINITAKPLLMERTINPNPASIYSGFLDREITLNNVDYKAIFELRPNVNISKLSNLVKKTRNDLHNIQSDLEGMIGNQFVRINPTSPIENFPKFFYLKKNAHSVPYLTHLVHYENFMKTQRDFTTHYLDKEPNGKNSPNIELIKKTIGSTNEDVRKYIVSNNITFSNTSRHKINKTLKGIGNVNLTDEKLKLIWDIINNGSINKKNIAGSLWKSRPFNPEILPADKQQPYVDLLFDPNVSVVMLAGSAGVGKTYFALTAGLQQVKEGKYETLTYIRSTIAQGQGLGFLPGGLENKISHIRLAAKDELLYIFGLKDVPVGLHTRHAHMKLPKEGQNAIIEDVINDGSLTFDIINFMGGRTIANSFIVIDEVHLFSKEELLFLMTRPDSLSKFVGIGDPNQLDSADIDEIRKKHLSPNQAGISHFIEDYKIKPSEKTERYDSSVGVLSIMGEEYVYRSLIAQIAEAWRNV